MVLVSLWFKRHFGGVEKRIAYNAQEFRAKRWQPKIRNDVALAMHGCRGNTEINSYSTVEIGRDFCLNCSKY